MRGEGGWVRGEGREGQKDRGRNERREIFKGGLTEKYCEEFNVSLYLAERLHQLKSPALRPRGLSRRPLLVTPRSADISSTPAVVM